MRQYRSLVSGAWGSSIFIVVVAALLCGACTRSEPARGSAESPAPIGSGTLAIATLPPQAGDVASEPKEAPPKTGACPAGMVLVEGEYCPDVEQRCLEWMDPPSSRYRHFRCARYAPSVCKSKERVAMRYCIDATERVEDQGEGQRHTGADEAKLPRRNMSWTTSKKLCEADGGRLCRESEWIFACEGEEMRPYPYGWNRDSAACNVDISENIGKPGRLVDHRAPVGSHAACASPFGVQDMAGNMEEWVQADGQGKMGWKEVLKGSWWIPSRHACRQFQVGHNDVYSGAETGTRCCKDAAK